MSTNSFSRKRSIRKLIQPVLDIDEDEDNKRRDSFGRKRVDVIECLIESSSDENDSIDLITGNSHQILWLTFAEICHIRSVLAQTILSTLMFTKDKQYTQILHGHLCFRCRKAIKSLFLLPSFWSSTNSFICYICQQRICKNCSVGNFLPPLLKHTFPVRIQTLINTSLTLIEAKNNEENRTNERRKTICYDCSQIFNEHRRPSQYPVRSSITEHRPSLFNFNLMQKSSLTALSLNTRL